MNVLVVDDEHLIRLVFEKHLSTCGHTVVTAKDAEDALVKMNRDQFDIFFLDMKLPDSSGMAILNRISELNYTPKKVVVCSASLDPTMQDDLNAKGIATLDKPFRLVQIEDIMNEVPQKERAREGTS